MYFKNNCGHVFVDGSKVIVETDTFKRTTEFWVFGFYGGKGLINHPSPNS